MPEKYFSYFVLMSGRDSNPGFSSNKPTHYLLDHGYFNDPTKNEEENNEESELEEKAKRGCGKPKFISTRQSKRARRQHAVVTEMLKSVVKIP